MTRKLMAGKWAFLAAIICAFRALAAPVLAQGIGTDRVGALAAPQAASKEFTEDFSLYEVDLASRGRNPFFILEPGYRLLLGNEDTRLIITVLNKTKTIKGVTTRVVEEREFLNGVLIERSLNYFAISRRNNSVFYFGEDVDIFTPGEPVSHEGAWLAGVNGAREGLIMPGIALLGARYAQEIAPDVALDRAEIVGVDQTRQVPAGLFRRVIETLETTPLEPGHKESTWYAPGVGLIQDADVVLLRFGFVQL
ncbi:MAG: hypothetical protein Q7T82_04050 [Armatimonadota bacterium]|nr:hypothetical protein [Armatimonadota bacterium]